jgi:hypothetical protein
MVTSDASSPSSPGSARTGSSRCASGRGSRVYRRQREKGGAERFRPSFFRDGVTYSGGVDGVMVA